MDNTIYNVVVENGYSHHKGLYLNADGELTEYIKPSIASSEMSNLSVQGGGLMESYEVNGKRFQIGPNVSDPIDTRSPGYQTSELNTALIHHSLVEMGFSGKKVRLCTGMPVDQFYLESGEINHDRINEVKQSMQQSVNISSGVKPAEIVEHVVMAEATSAILAYCFDMETKTMVREVRVGMGVIDIGGGTTDSAWLLPGGQIDKNKCGSDRIGALESKQKIRKEIADLLKIEDVNGIPGVIIETAFRDMTVNTGAEELVDVSGIVLEKKEQLKNKVEAIIQKRFKDTTFCDGILCVGGTSEALKDQLATIPKAIVPEKPQFQNALGMWIYLTYLHENQVQAA